MNNEELRELLIDLNRVRDRERRQRIVSDGILEGLQIITQSADTQSAFNHFLQSLRDILGIDHAFVVRLSSPGIFSVTATTSQRFEHTRWPAGDLFTRVLGGETVILFDSSRHPEWSSQTEEVRRLAVSALHTPLITPNQQAILVCLSSQKGYFHSEHQALLKRFTPLASQALNNLESSQRLREEAMKLKEAQQRLKQLDNLKSEFISTAAHELRTPIASIMGYTELLSDRQSQTCFSETQKEDFLLEILSNADRLAKIIDDILDVSRIEAGQPIPLHKQRVSIGNLLAKTIERFQIKSGRTIVLDISQDTPDLVYLDGHRIAQVIDNIISNAIKYSPGGTTIAVNVTSDAGSVRIAVADRGRGMSRDQLERIFDKFYRADAADSAVRGLGLGMSIARQIVDDHGGTISVDSMPGEGTTVVVTIPHSPP